MTAQPQEEQPFAVPDDGRVVYLKAPKDEHMLRNERALFLIEQYQKSGVINLPELAATLKGRRGF